MHEWTSQFKLYHTTIYRNHTLRMVWYKLTNRYGGFVFMAYPLIHSHQLISTHIIFMSYDWFRQLHTSYMRLNICNQYLWGGTLLLMGYFNKTCVLAYMLFIHSVVCLNIFLLQFEPCFQTKQACLCSIHWYNYAQNTFNKTIFSLLCPPDKPRCFFKSF